MTIPTPLIPPAPSSALPSPPTSPTSPRPATARIRIKPTRRPVSLINVLPTTSAEDEERTRSMSPTTFMTAYSDALSPESRTIPLASAIASKRRQSSIAYYTPSSPSPWTQRPQLNRALSSGADGPRDPGESIVSNGKENLSQRSSLVLSSRSPSTRESLSSSEGLVAREREPLTLFERHADLLHFIAQKERRCLELRDQLAAHEKELAELKQKWERIVNRGHDQDAVITTPLTANLGGAAFDGLKEGVRIIAAGFSDLGGVVQDLDTSTSAVPSKPKHLSHRENNSNASSISTRRTGSQHLSTSSMSSVLDSVHARVSEHVLEGGDGEVVAMTLATAPSVIRSGSLGQRVHKRTSRVIAGEPTTPTNIAKQPPRLDPEPTYSDGGMGMSPMLVPSLVLAPPPRKTVVRPVSAGPMSSWMDNVGKKLSGLQKSETFSKSQKRASSLLAGVSNTIHSALSPGPTATTPAPYPTSKPTLTMISTIATPTTKTPTTMLALASQRRHQPQADARPSPQLYSHHQPDPPSKAAPDWDWLEDDEERGETVMNHGPRRPPPTRTIEMPIDAHERTATAVSSFEDDDWNW